MGTEIRADRDAKVAATFVVCAMPGPLGPWNAAQEPGGAPYLLPGCLTPESALRHLLGALQAEKSWKGLLTRIFPVEGGEGYVVFLQHPAPHVEPRVGEPAARARL